MPYLNLDLDYFSHPKIVRLIGLLGRGAAELPIRLWCYCGKYHVESGNLASYSAQEIESAVGWWGKQGEMVEAMLKVGLLLKSSSGYEIKDWKDHQGHLVVFKRRALMGAKARWDRLSNASSNAKPPPKQCSLPYLTIPNQLNKLKTNPLPLSLGDLVCKYCGVKQSEVRWAFDWDHFIPRIAGGTNDSKNLILCCHVCNQVKQKRIFENLQEARDFIHKTLWTKALNRYVEPRKLCFGGKPPDGIEVALISNFNIPTELKANEKEIKEWLAFKREKGQTYKPRGLQALWKRIVSIPAEKRKEAIEHSMANNYAGIFEKRDGFGREKVTGTAGYQSGKYAPTSK